MTGLGALSWAVCVWCGLVVVSGLLLYENDMKSRPRRRGDNRETHGHSLMTCSQYMIVKSRLRRQGDNRKYTRA